MILRDHTVCWIFQKLWEKFSSIYNSGRHTILIKFHSIDYLLHTWMKSLVLQIFLAVDTDNWSCHHNDDESDCTGDHHTHCQENSGDSRYCGCSSHCLCWCGRYWFCCYWLSCWTISDPQYHRASYSRGMGHWIWGRCQCRAGGAGNSGWREYVGSIWRKNDVSHESISGAQN